MKFLLLAIAFFNYSLGNGQFILEENAPTTSVLIKFGSAPAGTGFFYLDYRHEYLVTAAHVLFQENEKGKITTQLRGDILSVTFYSGNLADSARDEIEIDVKSLKDKNMLLVDSVNDVCAVQLGNYNGSLMLNQFILKPGLKSVWPIVTKTQTKFFKDVYPSFEVYIFGYPTIGISANIQIDALRPLMRKGIVAGKNFTREKLILDCIAHPGNSGGPVLMIDGRDGTLKLIGIVVERVPVFDEIYDTLGTKLGSAALANSSYSVITPIDKLFDLLAKEDVVRP